MFCGLHINDFQCSSLTDKEIKQKNLVHVEMRLNKQLIQLSACNSEMVESKTNVNQLKAVGNFERSDIPIQVTT